VRSLREIFLIAFLFPLALSAAPRVQQYDRAGNVILQNRGALNSAQSLIFNADNRIIQAGGVKGSGIYVYSADGARLLKRSSVTRPNGQAPTVTELLNPGNYLTLELQPSGGLVYNVYLNGVRVAAIAPVGRSSAAAISYYLVDQVSSVKVTLNGQGNVLMRHEYLPYGEQFSPSGEDEEVGGRGAKFNAQEKDQESGLDFFNARHYDSEVAHFVSADTVVDGEYSSHGWNRYMYTHGNPVKYADPTGNIISAINPENEAENEYISNRLLSLSARSETAQHIFFQMHNSRINYQIGFGESTEVRRDDNRVRISLDIDVLNSERNTDLALTQTLLQASNAARLSERRRFILFAASAILGAGVGTRLGETGVRAAGLLGNFNPFRENLTRARVFVASLGVAGAVAGMMEMQRILQSEAKQDTAQVKKELEHYDTLHSLVQHAEVAREVSRRMRGLRATSGSSVAARHISED
jgi:RHS repeat-associated protein